MKNLLLFITLTFSTTTFSQMIYSKDGVPLGTMDEFMESCTSAGETKMMELDGLRINMKQYCSCAAENLLPTLTMDELQTHVQRGDLVQFFTTGENLSILMKCVEPNMEVDDDFNISQMKGDETTIAVAVEVCVNEALSDPEVREIMTDAQARDYCQCAVEGLFERGITMAELDQLEDLDGDVFNEVIVPCMTNAIYGDLFNDLEGLEYLEVLGGESIEEVPLIEMPAGGYKVQLSFAGVERYFLLDTGASDIVINQSLREELEESEQLTPDHYTGEQVYELANNMEVNGKTAVLDFVDIGEYMVFDVPVVVIDDASLLLGMSFLNKFKSWKIDKQRGVLILEK